MFRSKKDLRAHQRARSAERPGAPKIFQAGGAPSAGGGGANIIPGIVILTKIAQGWIKCRRAKGTPAAPVIDTADTTEYLCWVGIGSHIREGKFVQMLPSGLGTYPWVAWRPILGIDHEYPLALDSNQVTPPKEQNI